LGAEPYPKMISEERVSQTPEIGGKSRIKTHEIGWSPELSDTLQIAIQV
jgi:hypothetical protein